MRAAVRAVIVTMLIGWCGTAHAADVVVFHSRGTWAQGGSTFMIDECSQVSVQVWAGEDLIREGRQARVQANVSVSVSSYDWCTGRQASGGTTLADADFEGSLDGALLAAVPVLVEEWGISSDGCSWELIASPEYEVSVAWTGVGDISRGMSTWHGDYPGAFGTSHGVGAWRDASVAVRIARDGDVLVDNVADSLGQVGWHSDGTVSITRF